ncbi:hypothetical protein BCR44DRAFT_1490305, partial [Catenaria anguillulae PL171]
MPNSSTMTLPSTLTNAAAGSKPSSFPLPWTTSRKSERAARVCHHHPRPTHSCHELSNCVHLPANSPDPGNHSNEAMSSPELPSSVTIRYYPRGGKTLTAFHRYEEQSTRDRIDKHLGNHTHLFQHNLRDLLPRLLNKPRTPLNINWVYVERDGHRKPSVLPADVLDGVRAQASDQFEDKGVPDFDTHASEAVRQEYQPGPHEGAFDGILDPPTQAAVAEKVRHLNVKKASGPTDISGFLWKHAGERAVQALT